MASLSLRLSSRPFSSLSGDELHALYALRTAIFVVEQNCAYQEVDQYDPLSEHILAHAGGNLVGCARICPPHSVYAQPSIGRVAIAADERNKGWGRELFAFCLDRARLMHPGKDLKIQAQCYLEEFYGRFGFQSIGEPYPDVGIMHRDMLYSS
jgi:Predicted acyltransferase